MYVQLLGCIVGPLLATGVLIYLKGVLTKGGEPSSNPLKKLLYELRLHPEKGLADQGLLWASIFLPLTYFFALGYFAWQGYEPALTAGGYNTFIEISKLPLTLLALCIPLAVLTSRLHATKQTAEQITTTKIKNNFDMFLSHRKSMIEYFSAMENTQFGNGSIKFDFHIDPHLHGVFFDAKDPSAGIPKVNTSNFIRILQELEECGKSIIKIGQEACKPPLPDSFVLEYIATSRKIYRLANRLGIREIKSLKHDPIYVRITGKPVKTQYIIGNSFYELMGSFQLLRTFIRALCNFALFSTERLDQSMHHYKASTVGLTKNGPTKIVELIIESANNMASQDPEHFIMEIEKRMNPSLPPIVPQENSSI